MPLSHPLTQEECAAAVAEHSRGFAEAASGNFDARVEFCPGWTVRDVVHHLTAAFNSGDEGTDFQRFIEFSGKRLTLKPPPTKDGSGNPVQTSLVWERLSD